jgi:outer membrane protein TolC
MKTETKHTPIPWTARGPHVYASDEAELVAQMHNWQGEIEQEANAALIVRAVNNHESLASALADLRNAGRAAGFSGLSPDSWLRIALEKAERALANMETP